VAGRARTKPAEEDDETKLVRAVNLQLLRNLQLWGELEAQGIGEGTELRLTFVFRTPTEIQAKGLYGFLRGETDYELHVQRQGRPGKRAWFVAGATQPAPLSIDTLNKWTEWMIAAGAAHGPCAFEGWAPQSG
jgi:hypothetical protein